MTEATDEARARLAEWDGVVDHLVRHTPYVPPLTARESDDAYRQLCRAFRR